MNRPIVASILKGKDLDLNISPPAVALFLVCLGVGTLASGLMQNPVPGLVGGILGFYFLFSIKVIKQWEKVALMRLGKYRGLRGPGMIMIVPIFDELSHYVDHAFAFPTFPPRWRSRKIQCP